MAKTIDEATMAAAMKTPTITPVYADEAVEARQEVRREEQVDPHSGTS